MTRFSVLTPVYNTPPSILAETVGSVLAQSFPDWELCLVDDGSPRRDVRAALADLAARDPRIRLSRREANGGIVAASNDALAMAGGQYLVLLDDDDLLEPDALAAVNHVIATYDAAVVYTDEDKLLPDGTYGAAFRKPGWSPDYLDGCMYLGHLTVYRRDLVQQVGGFRAECEGSQDWDLALRVTERTNRIQHLAGIYYHWRARQGSVAASPIAKPYANQAARRALQDAMARRGIDGWLDDTEMPGHFLMRRRLPDPLPPVSVVLPTAGAWRESCEHAMFAVDGLVNRTDYPNLEIVCVVSEHSRQRLTERLRAIAGPRIRFYYPRGPFNYARAINVGCAHARGELLLLINDDVEPLEDPGWLRRMVELGRDPGVGVVGAKLLYLDGRIQHAGIVHGTALPYHRFYGDADGIGYYSNLTLNMNYLAVTGACQLVRREVFEEVGGYDPGYPMNFNDIDFCLKTIVRGYRVVQVNSARLLHFESATRDPVVTTVEVRRFLEHWAARTEVDEFASVCLP